MLTIAIGTKNPAKVNAIKEGIRKIKKLQNKDIKYILEKVETGVPEMPLTQSEIDTGARNRAEGFIKKGIEATYYIGLEGGCYKENNTAYLTGSVYITDGKKGYLGKCPSIQLPEILIYELYSEKRNLGELMDELAQKKGLSKKNGTFGELTDNLMTRTESFKIATILAMVPFFNSYYTQ